MEARDQSPKRKKTRGSTEKKVVFSENQENVFRDSLHDDEDSSKFNLFCKRLLLMLISTFVVYYLTWEVGILDPTRIGGYVGNVLFIPQQCYCDWKWNMNERQDVFCGRFLACGDFLTPVLSRNVSKKDVDCEIKSNGNMVVCEKLEQAVPSARRRFYDHERQSVKLVAIRTSAGEAIEVNPSEALYLIEGKSLQCFGKRTGADGKMDAFEGEVVQGGFFKSSIETASTCRHVNQTGWSLLTILTPIGKVPRHEFLLLMLEHISQEVENSANVRVVDFGKSSLYDSTCVSLYQRNQFNEQDISAFMQGKLKATVMSLAKFSWMSRSVPTRNSSIASDLRAKVIPNLKKVVLGSMRETPQNQMCVVDAALALLEGKGSAEFVFKSAIDSALKESRGKAIEEHESSWSLKQSTGILTGILRSAWSFGSSTSAFCDKEEIKSLLQRKDEQQGLKTISKILCSSQ